MAERLEAESRTGSVPCAPGDSPVLETRGLTRRFGGLLAVHDVDFQVSEGEIRGVIGPNGAGKTTLFNLITGYLKPSSGRVFFRGQEITGGSPRRVARRGIARKFQITQVFPTLSVLDNVVLAAQQRRHRSSLWLFAPCRVRGVAEEVLSDVHLLEKSRSLAGSLSHGEQQRLELGLVLATGAAVLLLDEPTAGMSVEERAGMAELVLSLAEKRTLVVTEHDFDFIKQVATTITVLNKGEKLAEGTADKIACDPRVRECYLGRKDARDQ